MSTTIIFGTKKLGQVTEAVAREKYPDLAVITVEGQKGAKKSRRVLLNSRAATLLNCEVGAIQNLVFASVEMGADEPKQVLIANADLMDSEVDVTYKTSKNKVAYDDSNEKGKAITSSHACGEIFKFLGLDDSTNLEFQLVTFPSDQIEAFALTTVSEGNNTAGIDELSTEAAIETNNGTMSGEDLQESISNEVAAAEIANPVLETVQEPVADVVDSEWN